MGHLAITAMGDGDYFREHAERDLAAAEDAGGYYVKGHAGGEPSAVFLGRSLEMLGITRHESPERSDQLMTSTWTHLAHPTTGEALGTALRQYADTAENLAKIATAQGVALPANLSAKEVRAKKVTLGEVQGWLAMSMAPEEVASLTAAARASQRSARTFYDLTYSADKSVSVLHVAAERAGDVATAAAIEDSLLAASEASFSYVEDSLGASRVGYHGKKVGGQTTGKRVRNRNLAAAAHAHHTSREGDPQDHVHTLILNRGFDETGAWHALDGEALYFARPSIAVRASRAQEMALTASIGARWESDGNGMRRLVGVDQELCDLFSKRRAVIEVQLERWAEAFRDRTGHEPRAKDRVLASQRFAKQTRKAKTEVDRDIAIEAYSEQADARGTSLEAVHKAFTKAVKKADEVVLDLDHDAIVTAALEKVAVDGRWNRHHLYNAIDAALPDNMPASMTPERLHALTLDLVREGLEREDVLCLHPDQPIDCFVPREMADEDGLSMFLARGREVFVPAAAVEVEDKLSAAARKQRAPFTARAAAMKLAADDGLVGDQAEALVGILSSARSLEALVGPAGTGKSYTLAKLAKHWPGQHVVGLTVSQNAAGVLMAEGFPAAMNLTRWFRTQERIAQRQAQGRPVAERDKPFVLKPGALVVIDEASMVETADLAAVVDLVQSYSAKVLLTGDHAQLDAVAGKGGAFSMLVNDAELREAGAAHELRTVRRFADAGVVREWEADASLVLRDGDASALQAYDDHGRLVMGRHQDMTAEAVAEAVAAHLTDKTSVLVTDSAEQAAALSMRVRAELMATGRVADDQEVPLHDGSAASVGDLIQARKNALGIVDSRGRGVTNRDVLVVTHLGHDGSIRARRRNDDGTLGASITLPAKYVAEEAELAYAATLYAVQGRTVDVAAYVLDPTTGVDRAALYVGTTRGRASNRVYVIAPPDAELDQERSVVDVLTEVVERDLRKVSATEMRVSASDAAVSLARVGPVWAETMTRLGALEHQATIMPVLEEAGLAQAVKNDEAAGAFWHGIAELKQRGIDPADALRSTLAGREVGSAQSVAQVLHYRLTKMAHMEWEPAAIAPVQEREAVLVGTYMERSPAPESLVGDLHPSELSVYARHLAGGMDARVVELGRRTAVEAPPWAIKHLGPVPYEGTSAREDWCERAGAVMAYREQYVDDGPVDVAAVIGREPSASRQPLRHGDWLRASEALGLGERVKDVAAMDDAELRGTMRRWAEAVEMAPAYVKPLLDKAHDEHRRASNRYDRMVATATVRGRNFAREEANFQAAAKKLNELQAAHEERGRWYADTTEIRDAAQEARAELSRREAVVDVAVVDVREDMDDRQADRYDRALTRQADQQQAQAHTLGLGRSL